MEHYVISDEEEIVNASPPFPTQFVDNVRVMKVNKNTKLGNIIDYAKRQFEDESIRHLIFEGIGDAADKCISCVEIFKRKSQNPLYQWNACQTAKRITYWDPVIKEMDRLKVTVDTPVIFILISKDAFPPEHQCLSMQSTTDSVRTSGEIAHRKQPRRSAPTPQGPNQWNRPNKDERRRLNKERDEAYKQVHFEE